jgi:hypothetical protein
LFSSVEVAKSEGVNDAASRSIQADRSFGSNGEFCSVDEERCCVKAMPASGGDCARLALVAGERKIDDCRDVVNESMSCQRRCEAEGWLSKWAKRRANVVNVNGYEYSNAVGVMGGKYLVSVSAAVRKETGLRGGDPIRVTLTLADGPRPVELPADFVSALIKSSAAKAFFDGLSNSVQRFRVDNVRV